MIDFETLDKVKIGGNNLDLVLEDRTKESGVREFGSFGLVWQKIYLDNQCHQEQKETILVHEIFETINGQNELGLTHLQICVLETAFYQVLKDNNLCFMDHEK